MSDSKSRGVPFPLYGECEVRQALTEGAVGGSTKQLGEAVLRKMEA